MNEALNVWIAAIESGYARDGDWIAWADGKITQLDDPPLWLLHVCVEPTATEALVALNPARWSNDPPAWDYVDGVRLRIGFMYLTYERDHTELLALVSEVIRLMEERDDFNVERRVFWKLEKEAAERPSFVPDYRPLADRVAEAFKPYSELARRMWSNLHAK